MKAPMSETLRAILSTQQGRRAFRTAILTGKDIIANGKRYKLRYLPCSSSN